MKKSIRIISIILAFTGLVFACLGLYLTLTDHSFPIFTTLSLTLTCLSMLVAVSQKDKKKE